MSFFKKCLIRLCGQKQPHQQFNFNNVSSVLIRPMGHLVGDTVAHTVYIGQLKAAYPNCRLGILTNKRSRPIYQFCPQIDELIDDTDFSCWQQRKKWQLYLDFYETYNSRHIFRTALLAPEATIIFHKTEKSYYRTDTVRNHDFHCPPKTGAHMSTWLSTSVLSQHRHLPAPCVRLETNPTTLKAIQSFWPSETYRILLAPQGSVCTRRIAPAELAALLNQIQPELRPKIQFLLCHTQGSNDYFAELTALCDPDLVLNLSAETSLTQYLNLTASADTVISIDSGTVHLACAFRRPLLAFYADHSENFTKWQPLNTPDVPTLSLIARAPDRKTANFPMSEAAAWLNRHLLQVL
ncbi:glycosyltransferase family 9 protein [Bergeriella denitrificans]|uniref:ADP-heptose--LPS heptosyltransferase II n=1 Tax=Bergeriella denitrificans TaxID=494 RepID=A0A378UJZ4_BERDE|nr:glycosyltransferase family 9 protein [Bergeriella denitrificans]STZ77450.1 ADP-heptose--LPS heptosyltransferase II [Bergeriella denitrificans]